MYVKFGIISILELNVHDTENLISLAFDGRAVEYNNAMGKQYFYQSLQLRSD